MSDLVINSAGLATWYDNVSIEKKHRQLYADMLSFQKKNAGQRATTSFHHAIFARARRTHDIYITVNKKIQFKGMV